MFRIGKAPFLECSSRGDRRFSAFFAIVNGKSIEDQYQAAKIFSDGTTGLHWRQAKGRHAVNMDEVRKIYSALWTQYLDEHPELVREIEAYEGFTDMFGKPGSACQAEEIFEYKRTHFIP